MYDFRRIKQIYFLPLWVLKMWFRSRCEYVTCAWPYTSLHVSVVITQLTAHLCERVNSYTRAPQETLMNIHIRGHWASERVVALWHPAPLSYNCTDFENARKNVSFSSQSMRTISVWTKTRNDHNNRPVFFPSKHAIVQERVMG